VARKILVLAIVLACAACGKAPTTNEMQQPTNHENEAIELAPANHAAIGPGEPDGLPDDRAPLEEPKGPIDPKSAEGAGQVLQLFGGLLEQKKFAEAYRFWSDDGRASGLSEAQFIASYGNYAAIHSEVGTPGEVEGAAGSSYVDIPFRLYGTLKSGSPFNQVGRVTLRRVNDVPGSTDEQRRWHIYKSTVGARP
jgi:hypothetical protein